MPQKDFILQEIEKISVLIQYLLGKYKPAKTIEEHHYTEKLFNKEFRERYGHELDFFLNMRKEDFDRELTKAKGFNYENIELLGDLFVSLSNNQFSESQKYLTKALELYEFIDKASKTFSFERTNKINSIKS
jgi:hypothetical protein